MNNIFNNNMQLFFLIIFLMMNCVDSNLNKKNQSQTTNDIQSGKIPIQFIYQPLTGGKKDVFLSGDFNNWSKTHTVMLENNGIYETTLYLKPGKYAYKFIVDGKWLNDDNAKEFIGDGFGGQNSVITVGYDNSIVNLRKVEFYHKPKELVKDVYLAGCFSILFAAFIQFIGPPAI